MTNVPSPLLEDVLPYIAGVVIAVLLFRLITEWWRTRPKLLHIPIGAVIVGFILFTLAGFAAFFIFAEEFQAAFTR